MVKEGYKETEIGVIPEDWDVKPLKDCVSFLDHRRIPIKDSERQKMRGIYPYYGASGIIDYVNKYIFDGTYILLGEDGANIIDRSSRLAFIISGKCWINNHAHVLAPNSDYDVCFLSEYLESIKYDEYNTGTAQPKLNREKCCSIPIPVPSLEEQQKIAEALSDTDSLISSLEKLIEKKKAIKQGAMQELLTGKKRLPGFSGEWQDVTLGECCEIYDGTHQTPNYTEYGMPFYSVENVTADDFANTKYISFEEHELLNKNRRMEKGDVLMTRIGSIGDCKYIDWDVNASFYVSLALIKCKKKISGQFLGYYSHTEKFKKEIEIRSLLTAIPQKINLGPISEIVINVPTDINEQNAITEIIFDMDNEIKKLEQKLAKYQKLKQGMMQQLLTGKIRLI